MARRFQVTITTKRIAARCGGLYVNHPCASTANRVSFIVEVVGDPSDSEIVLTDVDCPTSLSAEFVAAVERAGYRFVDQLATAGD